MFVQRSVMKRQFPSRSGARVFVRALDDALKQGKIDMAVHSMKISCIPSGWISPSAIPARDSPCDYIVTDHDLEDIKIIGTSSTRRTAQLRHLSMG